MEYWSRLSFWPRDQTHVSWISWIFRQILYHCSTWETGGNIRQTQIEVQLKNNLPVLLGRKEIKPVNSEGNQPWIFIGWTDAKAEAPILWPPRTDSLEKTLTLGKIDCKRRSGWQRMRWLDETVRSLTQWTWIWANSRRWWRTGKPGMLRPWGRKKLDMT